MHICECVFVLEHADNYFMVAALHTNNLSFTNFVAESQNTIFVSLVVEFLTTSGCGEKLRKPWEASWQFFIYFVGDVQKFISSVQDMISYIQDMILFPFLLSADCL